MSFSLLINNQKLSSKDLWSTDKKSIIYEKDKPEFKHESPLITFDFKAIKKPIHENQYDQFRIEHVDSSGHDTICTWTRVTSSSWITTVNNVQYIETRRCTQTYTGPCDEGPIFEQWPEGCRGDRNKEDVNNTSPVNITDYTHGINKVHGFLAPLKPKAELERADCPWYICAFIDMI